MNNIKRLQWLNFHSSSQIALGSLSAMEPVVGGDFAKMTFADSGDAKHSSSFVRTTPSNSEQSEVGNNIFIMLLFRNVFNKEALS